MSSCKRWRFSLQTAFSIIFFFILNVKLCFCFDTQEIVQVHEAEQLGLFDSSQDHFLSQSRVYGNRRSLIESFPDKSPALEEASPPPPENDTAVTTDHPPPPEQESPPSPPPSDDDSTQVPTQPPVTSLPSPLPSPGPGKTSRKVHMIVGIVVGGFTVLVASIIFFLILSRKIPIKPWTSSGRLQDSLITGKHTFSLHSLHNFWNFLIFYFYIAADVPKLQLSELQAACEEFSNIIGSFAESTIYKGTLSTGAEIAVLSVAAGSRAGWSTTMDTQFLHKIHNLSKVGHKNFLNVVGYCREEEPFNRMLVFEYAPNGSLFEHLHTQHAEHLDWPTRLRIAMGIAYCLEHMHNLNPPILHTNLDSSSVYLAEDNAAKVSDFSLINSISPSKEISSSKNLLEHSSLDSQTNVFNFGATLFEIISGKFPDQESLLLEPKPARDIVDPTLKNFQEDVVERLLEVVRQCMNPYSAQRPTMREVVVKLKEITGIEADAAMPRPPRWWTELEIISTEGN